MSNPVMTRNPYFNQTQSRPNQYDQRGNYRNGSPQQAYNEYEQNYAEQYSPENYAQQRPSAFDAPRDSGRMTYTDAMNKTALLLGTAVVSGVLTAFLLPQEMWMPAAWIGLISAFVVGMIIAFKRMVSPGLAMAYAILEGIALGAITAAFELIIPGIAIQTIIATAVIVGVTLGLHYSGAVRTTTRGRKFVLVVALGYIVFSLVNLVLMLTGVMDNAWGIRGVEIAGIPLGIILGAVMILVAAYMLIADFENVNDAIANGAPKEFAWTCGIAIVMTILWIYIEVLRIIAILQSNR